MKIYASWLSALSSSWDESALEQIRGISAALESQLAECAKSADLELQERAAELHGLLQLVRTGLDAPRPLIDAAHDEGDERGEGDEHANGFAAQQRAPPESLTLLDALFFAHELNPVNPRAQGMVTLPEGLDLEVPLFEGGRWADQALREAEGRAEETDEFGRPLGRAAVAEEPAEGKKKKKVKGSGTGKKSKRREDDPEELARVRYFHYLACWSWLICSFLTQQRADRLERQRDDPYYMDDGGRGYHDGEGDDVDSIPIVQLDLDLRFPPARTPTPPPREPTPPPMLVDVEGELPPGLAPGAVVAPSAAASRVESPSRAAEGSGAATPEQETHAAEGSVVKVVKKKKKDGTAGTKKKKKTASGGGGSGAATPIE